MNETERLNTLRCGDCLHRKLEDWWDGGRVCEIMGYPVDENTKACISILEKKTRNTPGNV